MKQIARALVIGNLFWIVVLCASAIVGCGDDGEDSAPRTEFALTGFINGEPAEGRLFLARQEIQPDPERHTVAYKVLAFELNNIRGSGTAEVHLLQQFTIMNLSVSDSVGHEIALHGAGVIQFRTTGHSLADFTLVGEGWKLEFSGTERKK